jgi:uncharacterized protein YmfQ (DUF2313 family)
MPTTIVPNQTDFIAFSNDENAQILAHNLPNGELYRAKNIPDSNFYKLLLGLAAETGRIEKSIEVLVDDYYIWTSTDLLPRWEQSLGIPDACFDADPTKLTADQRRRQIIAKLALMNLLTEEDFIALAAFFGYEIKIYNGQKYGAFPMTFPLVFFPNIKAARFTMIIEFPTVDRPKSFPYTFPIDFTESPVQFLLCLFNKLKPACVDIIFIYADD